MSEALDPARLIAALLTPSPSVHTPAITALQTHYDDLDDRSDAFRTLLDRFSAQSVHALCVALRAFVADASKSKDHQACVGRAQWLVRCFHDILDALCQPSAASRALLQAKHFLNATYRPPAPDAPAASSSAAPSGSSSSAGGGEQLEAMQEMRMPELVYELWNLMTTALAVIFRRTPRWAPSFERAVMVDWMRDALIFGRQMVEHIGAFEVAALGGVVEQRGVGGVQEIGRMTKTGKKLVKQAQVVLVDLVSWFRLTDVETLHQAFELVKLIVSRFTRSIPDLADPEFEQLRTALYEIDGFSRRETKKYRNRLSEDQLAELSELISPFDLPPVVDDEDEVQFAGSTSAAKPSAERTASPAIPYAHSSSKGNGKATVAESRRGEKDAFAVMMRRAGGGKSPPSTSRGGPSSDAAKAGGSSEHPIDLDDYDDEDFLGDLSAADLDGLEKQARNNSAKKQQAWSSSSNSAGPSSSRSGPQRSIDSMLRDSRSVQGRSGEAPFPRVQVQIRPFSSNRPIARPPSAYATSKPSATPKTSSAPARPSASTSSSSAPHKIFKSSLMQQARVEHRHHMAVRDKRIEVGGVTRALPAASNLGTGLGAYQGQRRTIKPVESSDSSSDDSGDEAAASGLSGLLQKQKSPRKLAKLSERAAASRPIKLLGEQYSDVVRQQEERRARQHAIKMRLKPDLAPLFRYILSWDPAHTGSTAPHPPKMAKELGELQKVPTTMPGVKKYEQVMLPLFLQELWAQFQKEAAGMGGRDPSVNVEVAGVAYEDDFVDLEIVVVPGPQMALLERFHLNDTDIVVLRLVGGAEVGGAVGKQVFGRIVAFKRKFREMSLKVRIMSGKIEGMGVKSRLTLTKHTSLSTALREFGALQGLPYYESRILQDVLAARSATMPYLSESTVRDAMDKYELNEPQARAVLGSLVVEGFALIQGPPGTGKTKTISGLVGKFLSERVSGISVNGSKPTKPKILVCAPSNAAIDEVCKRLMNGVPSANGGRITPNIVRIGIDSSVNAAVKDVAIDNLVESRVASDPSNKVGGGDYGRIQAELEDVKKAIKLKADEVQLADVAGDLTAKKAREDEYHALMAQRTALGQQSSRAKDAARDATRHLDAARRAAKEAVLADADVICATLSGAGQEILSPHTFETVIIDEAAQTIEASCLIPLKYGCRRCIMVGDPNQLPPTTFSPDAERCGYNESLFVRMVRREATKVALLSIQYRMHPFISELPSKVFYDGHLEDGPNMATKTAAVWHERQVYGPYRFFNVEGPEERAGHSARNHSEAVAAVELYRGLLADFGGRVNLALRVGVISMYKEQVLEIRRRYTMAFGSAIVEHVDFNTVDGFQGQEKDIIILSCVRSGPGLQTIGFLRDPRRMNVALTRAKSSLFVIGNAATLERSDERWRTIVRDARGRGFLVDYTSKTFAPSPPSQTARKILDKLGGAGAGGQVSPVKRKTGKVAGGGGAVQPPTLAPAQGQGNPRPSQETLDAAVPLKRAKPTSPKKLVRPPRLGPAAVPTDSTSTAEHGEPGSGPASDEEASEAPVKPNGHTMAKATEKAHANGTERTDSEGSSTSSSRSSSRYATPETPERKRGQVQVVVPLGRARSGGETRAGPGPGAGVAAGAKANGTVRSDDQGQRAGSTSPALELEARPLLPPLRPEGIKAVPPARPQKAEELAFIKRKKKKLSNGKPG